MEYLRAFTKRDFKVEFKISKFKDSPISIPEDQLVLGKDSGVRVSIRGNGVCPENKGFVVFRMEKNFDDAFLRYGKTDPFIFHCVYILSILDTEGHDKFPRTYAFENDSECSGVYEERYIERSSILNNASEYLQEETITITVEGTLEVSFGYRSAEVMWISLGNVKGFKVEQLEQGLKVYLCNSAHDNYLRKHSKVFRDMWNVSMQKTTENIILSNEELPAFLCMLLFIETDNLVLHEATISDLYKIADKYDIPILLQECRKHIAKYLPRNASAVLEFATYYHDVDLKRIAEAYMESHSHELRESDDDLEEEGEWDDDFVCDTRPVCSSLIKTEEDFEECLRNIGKHCKCPIPEEDLSFTFLLPSSDVRDPLDFYQ